MAISVWLIKASYLSFSSLDGTYFIDILLIPDNTASIWVKRERQKLFYLLDTYISLSFINFYLNLWKAIAANF